MDAISSTWRAWRRSAPTMVQRAVSFATVLTLLVSQLVFVPASFAAFTYTGGADQNPPIYILNDHTVYAIHVTGTGVPPSQDVNVSVKLSDTGLAGGFTTAPGFTWNATAGRWVQSREAATSNTTATSDAGGNVSTWVYFKCGNESFAGFPAGNGHGANQAFLTVQLQAGLSNSGNPSIRPIVTILDAATQGAWVHNGVATGVAAAQHAEAVSTDGLTYYSAQKTEANLADDNDDAVIDNEDYGPAGATGDFRLGLPAATTINVNLGGSAWAPGQGVASGAADTDIALGAADQNPPSTPSGLSAAAGDGSVALSWTGSTDSGGSGLAGYTIYRSKGTTYPVQGTGNASLTSALRVPIGSVGSGTTTYTDATAVNGNTYYYFVRATDSATNASARSNQVSAMPVADTTAPSAVADLSTAGAGTTSVDLTWTAPGDDGSVGTASAYDLRYSTSPIPDNTAFAAATPASGVPAPQVAGSSEAFTVTGLASGQHYYFALKTRDEVPNWSALSNQADATTAPAPAITNVWRFSSTDMFGNFLWTSDPAEKATIEANLSTTWALEGPAFTINAANLANNDTVWRFKNKNVWTYFYTADASEMQTIKNNPSSEWSYEGPTYQVSRDVVTATPVWRFRCLKNPTYLWTADPTEMATIDSTLKADYQLEGIAYYLGQ